MRELGHWPVRAKKGNSDSLRVAREARNETYPPKTIFTFGSGQWAARTPFARYRLVEAMSTDARITARLEIVDEHIRQENQHDLAGIMRTLAGVVRPS